MKKYLLFIILCFAAGSLFGQSTVTIGIGSSISVGNGSDLQSGYRDGTMLNSGYFNSRSITFDPVATAATSVGQSSFNANWNSSSGASGYRLDVSLVSNFSSFVTGYQNLDVGNTTSFAVNSGLSSGTTYYYRVRAYDIDGITGYSNVIVLITAPAPPVASAATSINESSFITNWAAVTGATKYYLDVATTEAFTAGTFVTGYQNLDVGNVITFTVNTNLTANNTYYYRVRGANAYGSGNSSNIITLKTAPIPPVASAATSLAQTSFSANWNAPLGATRYYLDVATTAAFTAGTFVTGYNNLDVGNVTVYSVNTNLTAGTTYYFRVRSNNDSGTSTNSNTITVLTVPPDPVATAATTFTQTSFSANWGASTSATKYYIDVATDNTFTTPVAAWTNVDMGNVTTYSVNTNLTAGTTYYYRIRSENASGTSGSSNIITAVTVPPNPVTTAAADFTTTSFTANWNTASGATKYYLDVSTSNVFAGYVTGWNNVDVGNVTTYSVGTNLTAGTTYYYRVRAYNANGTSGNSNVTSLITVPPAPVQTAATDIATTSFTANWNASTGADKYYLDVATDNLFTLPVAGWTNVDVANVTSYSVNTNITATTNYYYRVRAFNISGTSANSGTATLITSPGQPVATASSSTTSTAFDANWNVTAGATGYYLDVATDINFTAGTFVGGYYGLDVSNVLTYTVNLNLIPGTTYFYRVRSYNAGGTSGNSNIITTITSPAAPVASAASANTSVSFSANWNSSVGATGYRIDVSTASDFSAILGSYNDLNVNNVNTYSVTGLSANTPYYYRVRAYNAYGSSVSSSYITALTSPAAPADQAAADITAGSFTAKWNASAGATGYYLDVSSANDFSSYVSGYQNLDAGNVTSRSVTLPTSGSTYYYRVRAYSTGGTSPNSGTQTVVTLPTAPSASPASGILAASFSANWSAAAGATGYRLDASTDPLFGAGSFVASFEDLDVLNVTTKSVTGLSAGVTYYYRIRGYNATGTGINSNIITVTTKPAAPLEQAATGITNNSFAANWNASTGATGYRLDVSSASDFSSFLSGFNNLDVGNVITYTINGLSPATSYYYRIRAYNSAGTSASSGNINPTTSGVAPRAPAANPASNIAATSFSANWSASSGATKYFLDVSSVSNFATFVTAWENVDVGNVITYSVNTNLSAGTHYYYRVRAFNADGTSGNSSVVSLYTKPAAPVEQNASNITNSSFSANWTASTGASGYYLDVSTASDFSSFVTGYNNLDISNVTTYSVTGLVGLTPYYYRIRAYNTGGTSASSGSKNPTTLADPAGTVTATAATGVTETAFNANWTAFAGATGYKMDVATTATFDAGTFVGSFSNLDVLNVITYPVSGLTGGTVYYYQVRAYDGGGTIGTSGVITVLTKPAAPTANAAGSITETSLAANWTASTGATGYYLDAATDAGFTSFVTGFNNIYVNGVTTYTITGLTGGTEYFYRVRAKNSSGTGTSSGTISAYTIPKEPNVLAATTVLSTSFDANWSAATGAARYYIDVATDNVFGSMVAGWSNVDVGNVTTKTINTGLSSGTTYYYRLRSSNTGGTSGNSGLISLTTAPAVPTINDPTAINQSGFTANWTASAGATKYFLDVATTATYDAGTYVSGYQDLDVGSFASYPVSGLAGGTVYYYRVRAFNSNGTSGNSGNKSATTIPADPSVLPASNIASTEFKAKWSSSTGATKYYFDVATDNTFATMVAGWTNKDAGVATEYTVNTGLSANTTYYYRIRAYNASGTSGNSGTGVVTTSPSAPVATAATALQETSIAANWNVSAGADGYYLDVSTQNDFSSYVVNYQNLNVQNVTSYTVTGLTGGTTYYYRIRSYSGGKPSDNSNTITALTKPVAPVSTAPSSVVTLGFDANWNTTSSATGYKLEVSTNSGFTSYIAGYNPKDVNNVLTYSIPGLTANTSYFYRVSAYNASGTGASSSIQQVLTAPAAPVSAAATSITNTTMTANWSASTGATGYRLDVATDAGFGSILIAYSNKDVGNVTSYGLSGLNGNITYYYRVRAYNTGGTSGNSGTITTTTLVDPCAAPVSTAGTALAKTSFSANWNTVATASGYTLDAATDILFTSFVPGFENLNVGNVLTYSVTGLSSGTTYYFRTRSYNVSGISSNSNVVIVLTAPHAPAASAATALAETSFSANWSASTGAAKYYLDVATDNTFLSMVAGYSNKDVGNVITYSVTGLAGGNTYYYRVRSNNASGTSGNSGTITALTPPPVPVASAATSVTETAMTANWALAAGASKYYFDLSTDNAFGSFVTGYNNKDVGNVSTLGITGLTANTTYYYRVRSFNANGTSGNSNIITIVGLPTSSAATAKSSSEFTANWTLVAGATKYYLDVSTASDFSAILPAYNNLDAGDAATTTVTSLAANTTYYYRVRAFNATGLSGNSGTITVLTAPAAPVTTAATSITPTAFTANWGASVGATGYFLDISTDAAFTAYLDGYQNKDVANVLTENILNIERGTSYYYRVRAYNASASSINSNVTSILAAPLANPAVDIMQNSISANWNTVTGATKYYLDVATDIGFTTFVGVYNNKDVGLVTSINIAGLTKNTEYFYRVRSFDGVTTSGNSNIVTTRTLPDAPTANAATLITQSEFNANWIIPGGSAPGYKLDVSTVITFATFVDGWENRSVGNVLSYQITGLTPGGIYYYRVRALNSWGASDNSNIITVSLKPANPVTLTATNITVNSATVNWNAALGATGYMIDVASDNTFTTMILNNFNAGNVLSLAVGNLTSNTQYYYRVRGYNAAGASSNSNVTSVTTLAEKPILAKIESGAINYILKQSEAGLTDSITVLSPTSTPITNAAIQISNGFVKGEDVLSLHTSNGIAGSWDNESGTMVLTGAFSAESYQQAIREIKYSNISLQPTSFSKQITITVNNGFYISDPLSRNVVLKQGNDAPLIKSLEVTKLNYIKGVTGLRLIMSDSLTTEDTDSYYLYGATVKIATGYIAAEDNIDFNNTATLIGVFDKDSGTLTITGKGTVMNYQSFLRDLNYRNSSGANGTSSRKTFVYTINDGLVNSASVTRQFEIKSPLETPTNLKANITSNKVDLTWNDTNRGEGGYIIERSEGNNSLYTELARVDSNVVKYSDASIQNGKKYFYRVAAFRAALKSDYSNEVEIMGIVVGISDQNGIPKEYVMSQNYPNPFNPATSIVYGLPYESKVRIEIYNTIGQLIEVISEESKAPGYYKVNWKAEGLASGIYIYRISAVSIDRKNKFMDTKRMILMK